MNRVGLAIIAVGLLVFFAGPLALSGTGSLTCIQVYGIGPSVIQTLGTPVSAQSYFQAQSASPTFSGFSNWQGPAPLPAGYLNPPATQGSQWAATPTGSPAAVLASNGFYTNPTGGPLASITWENTIYSLAPGTYYWSTITGYVGTTAPTYTQSGGSYGTAIVSVTTYYDLALYLSGGCTNGGSSSSPTTTTTMPAPTTTSTPTTTTTSTGPTTSQGTATSSQTVTATVTGTPPPKPGNSLPVQLIGIGLIAVGGFVSFRKRH